MSELTCGRLQSDHEAERRLRVVAVGLAALLVLSAAFDGRNGITDRATSDRQTAQRPLVPPTMPELIAEMLSHD